MTNKQQATGKSKQVEVIGYYGKEATAMKQAVGTPAAVFIDRNNVMIYGAEKGRYMPIRRCMDDMCACIAELEREAGCIYSNDWV